MARIASFGAYVPAYRLSRQEIANAWGVPAIPGERSVANADEDSLTMAVAAGLDCLAGIDPAGVDGVFFATTTAPYDEKQCAGVIAAALDLRRDIHTADFTGSLRAATTALRSAAEAVDSGSAASLLVVAADCRLAEPGSMWEQLLGDGAGAVLISREGPAAVRGLHSVAGEQIGVWRRSGERYIRSFEPKAESKYGYLSSVIAAGKGALEKSGAAPGDISRAVIPAGDPRSLGAVAAAIGIDGGICEDTLFLTVGDPGTPLVLMMLAGALERARGGERLLVVNYGDGADGFVVEVEDAFPRASGRRGLAGFLQARRPLPSYAMYADFRDLIRRDRVDPRGSAVTYWRDANIALAFHGARCGRCGTVLYPIPRVCAECGAKDQFTEVRLGRRGTVFTYTLDHIDAGRYVNTPVPRLVVDLDGGGRVFLTMTDADPAEAKIGLEVELVFRRLHEGAGFHNYYWKCRPATRTAA